MQEYVNPHCNILIIVSSILKVIMVSIINRTEEDQTKIIDKGAKNKFNFKHNFPKEIETFFKNKLK